MSPRSPKGEGASGDTPADDSYQPRTVAGVPSWALAMIGAGTLVIGAGFVGYWSANRSVATQPVAFTASAPPSSAAASSVAAATPGPDGMFPTPTPLVTTSPMPAAPSPVTSGLATPVPVPTATAAPVPTGAPKTAAPVPVTPPTAPRTTAAVPVNPATAVPKTTAPAPKPPTAAPTTKAPSRTTAPPQPAPATSTAKPASPSTTATTPDPDEVAVGGPPSGLIVTTTDLSYGKCPAKFATAVEVEAEYGTVASARAKWVATDTGAKGSADLPKTGSRLFSGTVSGIPTKTPVVLTVEVTGPDGTATNDPFQITHSC